MAWILTDGDLNILLEHSFDRLTLADVATNPSPGAAQNDVFTKDQSGYSQLWSVDDNGVAVNLWHDSVMVARNASGSDMNKGDLVYISGSTGNVATIALAQANDHNTHANAVLLEDIANNSFGLIGHVATVTVNTVGEIEGDTVWLSADTPGAWTTTEPTTGPGVYIQQLGTITKVAVAGIIHFDIQAAPHSEHVDHGSLVGLLDDDHTQYHNDSRAATWLSTNYGISVPAWLRITKHVEIIGGFNLFINEVSNDDVTQGVVINQGSVASDQILALMHGVASHPFTDDCDQNTYGAFKAISTSSAGVNLQGWADSTRAVRLDAFCNASDSTKTSSALGCIELQGSGINGNTAGNLQDAQNVVVIRGYTGGAMSTLWICDENGDTWQSGDITVTGLLIKGSGNLYPTVESTDAAAAAAWKVGDSNQTWQFGKAASDNFTIYDVTNSKEPFTVEPNGVNYTLYVDSNGRVGVRTNTPGYELDVREASSPRIAIIASGANSNAALIVENDASQWQVGVNSNDVFLIEDLTTATAPFAIETGAPTGSMRIDSAGYLGLGTTNPLSPLHIALATEDLEVKDAGSTGATEQDWVEVEVGGNVGYIRVYATK